MILWGGIFRGLSLTLSFFILLLIGASIAVASRSAGNGNLVLQSDSPRLVYKKIVAISEEYGVVANSYSSSRNQYNNKEQIYLRYQVDEDKARPFFSAISGLAEVTSQNFSEQKVNQPLIEEQLNELDKELALLSQMLGKIPNIAELVFQKRQGLQSQLQYQQEDSVQLSINIQETGYNDYTKSSRSTGITYELPWLILMGCIACFGVYGCRLLLWATFLPVANPL